MILDTTYLLPLAQIAVDTDLLEAIANRKTDILLEEVSVSLISIFELQAKAAKLSIPAKSTAKAVNSILTAFRVAPFYETEIIDTSFELRRIIPDYLDCVVVATAIFLKEDLATEDSLITSKNEILRKKYDLRVLSFRDIIAK